MSGRDDDGGQLGLSLAGGVELAGEVDPLFLHLYARAEEYASDALAPATRRLYVGEWRAFVSFCSLFGAAPLPAHPDTVRLYLAHMADRGRRPAGIDVALAAISHAHTRQGLKSPRSDRGVLETRSGIRRRLGVAQQPKGAMTTADLRAIVEAMPATPIGIRDRALLLLGWVGAFRPSELAALLIADLSFQPQPNAAPKLRVSVRRSKTDQEGRGLYKWIPPASDETVCPVRATMAWLEVLSREAGPLFPGHRRNGWSEKPLCRRDVARRVKRGSTRAQLDAAPLSGASLRSGFVTAAVGAGKPIALIMAQTGHRRAETLIRYVRGAALQSTAAEGLL